MLRDAATTTAIEKLGIIGRMISYSKSDYLQQNPNNIVVFNANVCTDSGKIWYGDLDVTKDGHKLQQLAAELNETVFVLSEMDGRFENEAEPIIEKARATFSPDGSISFRDWDGRVRTETRIGA